RPEGAARRGGAVGLGAVGGFADGTVLVVSVAVGELSAGGDWGCWLWLGRLAGGSAGEGEGRSPIGPMLSGAWSETNSVTDVVLDSAAPAAAPRSVTASIQPTSLRLRRGRRTSASRPGGGGGWRWC